MDFSRLTYPPYGTPLVEAWERRFEAAFVLFHPFIRVPEALSWKATKQYPTDQQIATNGERYSWTEVVAATGLRSCAHLNTALLTSTGALPDYLSDLPSRDALQSFLQLNPVWMPTEGRFEPLLQHAILDAFQAAGFNKLVFIPEMPNTDPLQRILLNNLGSGRALFPSCGTLVAPDASFLFTVDWDSFFSVFYGPRDFVRQVVRKHALEGFVPGPLTEHAWFNYTMGCATVTVSPEDLYQAR
jgi:hypothetical protein